MSKRDNHDVLENVEYKVTIVCKKEWMNDREFVNTSTMKSSEKQNIPEKKRQSK